MRPWAKRWTVTGVWPLGAQVRLTVGMSRKPDSSAKAMWARSLSAFFYPGPVVCDPVGYSVLVALRGAALGLLMAPAHLAQEPADVVAVVTDVELALDDFGDAGRGPKVGAVARGNRSLQEDLLEGALLLLCELGRPARSDLDLESVIATCLARVSPPHHARRSAVYQLCNFIQGSALVKQFESPVATVFQYFRRTRDSHNRHHLLVPIMLHY